MVRIPFWSDEDRALVVWPLGVALNAKYIAKRLGWLKKQARASVSFSRGGGLSPARADSCRAVAGQDRGVQVRGEDVIATEGLTRRFGDLVAVENLDLVVAKGEVFGFLGPNGAGKTTTIRLLSALIAPDAGTGTVAGLELGRENRAIRQRVGVLTETPGLYKRLSVGDGLLFFARLYSASRSGSGSRAIPSLV